MTMYLSDDMTEQELLDTAAEQRKGDVQAYFEAGDPDGRVRRASNAILRSFGVDMLKELGYADATIAEAFAEASGE